MKRTLDGCVIQFRDSRTGKILRDSDGREDTGDDYEILDQVTDQWGRHWFQVEGPSGQVDIVLQDGTIWRDAMEDEDQTLADWVEKYADEN